MGVASLSDGQFEAMLHRRTTSNDHQVLYISSIGIENMFCIIYIIECYSIGDNINVAFYLYLTLYSILFVYIILYT